MEAEFRSEFQDLSNKQLEAKALAPDAGMIPRGRATFELARRSLDDHALLEPALDAIDLDRVWKPKSFPPLGWLGAIRILGSNDRDAISVLLKRIVQWDENDQQALFQICLPPGERSITLKRLASEYDWTPGFTIDD